VREKVIAFGASSAAPTVAGIEFDPDPERFRWRS
jgi:hypothetical protein